MENAQIALLALSLGALVIIAAMYVASRNRSKLRTAALREQFGTEYERTLAQHGDRARAERELMARRKRLRDVELKPLTSDRAARFERAWSEVQQHFVDDPSAAVGEADSVVKELMRARGYPMGNFEQRVADLSVEHADVVHHYRYARGFAEANRKGEASTEDLRQAIVHYRALVDELLKVREDRRSSERPSTSRAAAPLRQSHA